jgi:hypothetical protein
VMISQTMSGTETIRAKVSVLGMFTSAQTPGSPPIKHRLKAIEVLRF